MNGSVGSKQQIWTARVALIFHLVGQLIVVAGAAAQTGTAFTDDPLVPGVTVVRAVHFRELRTRIDALRTRVGLPAFAWTDRTLTPGVTPVRHVHLTEMREALAAAYEAAGRSAPAYGPRVAAGTPIRAGDVTELRIEVIALEAADRTSVSLSVSPNPVAEGSAATVTAVLSEALPDDVTVPLTLTAGTAEAGDYGSLPSITIDGGSRLGVGTITTTDDADTDDETFTVALGSLPPSVTAGNPLSIEITIEDTGALDGLALDRAALVALYEATDGPNWRDNSNWLTDAPIGVWRGVYIHRDGRVGELSLINNDLSGPIPPELGDLTELSKLELDLNALTGPIPPELGNLTNLRHFSLDGNELTGSIPPELGNLSNLWILSLWDTGVSGSIPPELGKLTNVWYLRLLNNNLSGPIPPELGDMASLTHLRLDWNTLTGPIPPELGNLATLEQLHLNHNALTGPIPPSLGDLSNLEGLNLSSNRLTGSIPPELGKLSSLIGLYLSHNNLTGEFPAFLLGLPALEEFFLGPGFCAPADPAVRARLGELHTDLFPCPDANVRLLSSALMREDGNGISLALPDDLRTPSSVTVSDPSVVAASVADGWLTLSPRMIGSADVTVLQAGGGSAVAHVEVREAVGTFGIDIVVDQPVPFGYEAAMVEGADWWSDILDGTEWPDREAGCPTSDPFGGKVKAVADELLVVTRVEELENISGYASGCFFPVDGGREVPALDPGGGYVVMGGFPSQGLVRHEIGHLLGLVSWRSEQGLATSDCQFFTGSQAVKAFHDGGGDPDLPGVPIQTGCGSHWHEDIVDYELMAIYGGWDANSISLGALVDAGYTVDLSKALRWPVGTGFATQAAREGLARDVVLGEPRVFIERRPRDPPR